MIINETRDLKTLMEANPTWSFGPAVRPERIKCDCGHTVSKINVMTTATGTACPDCYDRMSV
jgi:hypothetical protein